MRFCKALLILLILLLPACAGSRPLHTGQLGQPLTADGVTLTALRVFEKDHRDDGSRGLYVEVAVVNVDHPTLTITPSAFHVVDTSGDRHVAEFINYSQHPPDDFDLAQHQTVSAHVNFSVPGAATLQTLQYRAFSGADGMEVALPRPAATPIPVADLDLKGSGAADVSPPDGWTQIDVFDTVPDVALPGGLPMPDAMLGFMLQRHPGIGMVHIMGYASADEPLYLFNRVTEAAPTGTDRRLDDVGERAVLFTSPRGTTRQLNFTRCQVHVMLQFIAAEPEVLPTDAEVIAYAQRLDAVLQPQVCR